MCKGKQKKKYNIKISYTVLDFEANKSSQNQKMSQFILKNDTFAMKISKA